LPALGLIKELILELFVRRVGFGGLALELCSGRRSRLSPPSQPPLLAQAMCLGKPVITAYSYNLDYMNNENSFRVKRGEEIREKCANLLHS